MVSRRALLGGAALVLAGCGDDDDGAPPRAGEQAGGDSTLADLALLNDALAAERAAASVLPSSARHVRVLEREIARLRGRPEELAGGAPVPDDAGTAAAQLIALYVDMLPKLAEPRLRGLIADVLADAARSLASLRVERGQDPAPQAFVAGRA